MVIVAYILAAMIVLVRVCVPISNTDLGGWPARLLLFVLWCVVIIDVGGNNLAEFARTLRARWLELACYWIWVAVLAFYWLMQGGDHLFTFHLLNCYVGVFPFYILGTYYSVKDRSGQRMALSIGVVVGLSCLQALPTVWQNPELVRRGVIELDVETRSLGIGNYGDLTGFAIALPFFIVTSLQSKRFARMVGLACCIATMVLLMIATLSGIILLTGMAVTGCVLYYLLLGGLQWRRILLASTTILVIGLAAIFVFPSVYERASFGRYYDKLVNTFGFLPDILAGRVADPTDRYMLMLKSLGVFLDNPVIGAALEAKGIGTSTAGGHSSWIDALANYGLIGGVPYFLFHLLIFRRLWQAWRSDRQNALYWGCLLSCVLYLFYGFFNVTTQATTVALFLYATSACGQRSEVLVRPQPPVLVRRIRRVVKR